MWSGILVVVCMALAFSCLPGIYMSLFSFWFCLDSQSAMNISGPGLYMILTLYWCILSRIHCSLCDSVAMCFLNIVTSSLWSLLNSPLSQSSNDGTFLSPYIMPSASLSMLLYLFSTLDRLLLANAMGLIMLSSGTSSQGQHVACLK